MSSNNANLSPPPPGGWDLIIRPRVGWFDLHLADLWRYRDLVFMFVRRDFVAQFKQTILGPAWFVLQPLLTTLVFVVVFGNIANLGTDGLPKLLFYLSGNVVWTYYSNMLAATSTVFVTNAHLFGKVYFPRLAVPVSLCISHLMKFALQFAFFIGFWIYYYAIGSDIRITAYVWLLPVVLLIMMTQSLGLGILFSAMTTKYRDLRFLLDFGIRLLMYAAPVVYSLGGLADPWRSVLVWNPMTPVFEIVRLAMLGQGTFSIWMLSYSALFSLVVLFVGAAIFNRVDRTFMDTV